MHVEPLDNEVYAPMLACFVTVHLLETSDDTTRKLSPEPARNFRFIHHHLYINHIIILLSVLYKRLLYLAFLWRAQCPQVQRLISNGRRNQKPVESTTLTCIMHRRHVYTRLVSLAALSITMHVNRQLTRPRKVVGGVINITDSSVKWWQNL